MTPMMPPAAINHLRPARENTFGFSRRAFSDAILATTNAMIAVIDRAGIIVQVNRGLAQSLGYATTDLIGKSWHHFVPLEEYRGIEMTLEKAFADDAPVAHECALLALDGRQPWVAWTTCALRSNAGAIKAAVCTGIDITAQRQAMAAAMRAERDAVIGRMAGRVAHEVNNPLEAIKALIEPLRIRSREQPTVVEGLDIIDRQVDRIANLARTLLGLAHQRPSNRTMVLPAAVLVMVAALFQPRFAKAGKRLEVMVPGDLPPVSMDADQVQQAVINLLENALAALDAGGCVRITAAAGAGWLEIAVMDDGPGLGKDPERLFQPFYTTKADGTGLGLAMTRSICEAHGGWIDAENRQPHGACFRLHLRTDLPDGPATRDHARVRNGSSGS